MSTPPSFLADALAALRERASAQGRARYDAMVKHLIASGMADGALKEGDTIPSFVLTDADGNIVDSDALLVRGPLVLSFYRGAWCPYCSAELEALQQTAAAIYAAGATLVAITPETGGLAAATRRERHINFTILCDLDNGLALAFGLVFRVPEDVRLAYVANGPDLARINGNDSWFLPVPATYIVDRAGRIVKSYVNADFRERLEPADIVAALVALQNDAPSN